MKAELKERIRGGTYAVDSTAVAAAILQRSFRERRSAMLMAAQALAQGSVAFPEGDSLAGDDLA